MKKTLALVFTLLICVSAYCSTYGKTAPEAKQKIYQGYSGGMMLHLGYAYDCSGGPFAESGLTKGIGGAVKIHLWKHLRVGSEGYVSSLGLDNDGYIRSGWGGLLAEWWGHAGKFHPYAGLTLGGGSQKNFHLFEGSGHDWEKEENAIFHKTSFFAAAPYIGCEFSITAKLKLTLKTEWLLAIKKEGILRPGGPRLHLGFLFGH